ncbi:ribonuclease H-like domain-containing protein [Sedimentibacter sp. MB31-C6]|uniref:ribonuclease H-like domain-containing protein n=1 Tax=Sedimentibacter sp. MB31-C6 TaxID=3109366 RepID=UPI002DDCAA69|nr:ribonuclease H-like domain-containing protein [Sedimentibacter sp. MB36-C1]WSI03932.1 ribonuclease H-like domain-containing protein [Sedimentibacter sp. MB36-C1]
MIVNCNKINNNLSDNLYINKLLKDSFFLDIETTGLSRKFSMIISITVMLYIDNNFKIYQLFCENKTDEKEILKYLKDLINDKNFVITYNGNSFDIPFLIGKYLQNEITFDFNKYIKIDLYNDMRHVRNKIQIENLKLKTVERYFNIKREDAISGQDVTVLYEAYKIDPKKEFSFLILQHNYKDVYNLSMLFNNIFSLYDETLFYNGLIVKINYTDFSIKKNTLYGKFYIISKFKADYIHPSLNFDLKLNSQDQILDIQISVGFYKDEKVKEFYYIDNNDFNINTYTAIKGIKNNLIPIKINDKFYTQNIINITKKILDSLF